MSDETAFRRALSEREFDLARAIAERSPNRDVLEAELASALDSATEDAARLYEVIVGFGSSRDYRSLRDIGAARSTAPLLALLSDASRERADLYLRETETWAESKHRRQVARLRQARTALDGLDLAMARGLLGKIDGSFLTDEERTTRDDLYLELEARSMEMEPLESTAESVVDEMRPKRRRWWKRR